MDEQEAEAALLALALRLEWRYLGENESKRHPVEEAMTGQYWYSIYLKTGRNGAKMYWVRPYLRVWPPNADRHPYCYTSRPAAKAACERHYATGKWK